MNIIGKIESEMNGFILNEKEFDFYLKYRGYGDVYTSWYHNNKDLMDNYIDGLKDTKFISKIELDIHKDLACFVSKKLGLNDLLCGIQQTLGVSIHKLYEDINNPGIYFVETGDLSTLGQSEYCTGFEYWEFSLDSLLAGDKYAYIDNSLKLTSTSDTEQLKFMILIK